MSDKDGGEAFPLAECGPKGGMTLRDYFAGQALAGIGTWNPRSGSGWELSDLPALEKRAIWAYAQADAMLEARKR